MPYKSASTLVVLRAKVCPGDKGLAIAVVQWLSHVWLFATPRTAVYQASLSFAISRSLLRLISTELVLLSDHSLPTPSPPSFNPSQHQGIFLWVSPLHQVAKVLEFVFSISPSNEYSGLISFRIDWLDLLAVQGTLKSLLQYHIICAFYIYIYIVHISIR